MITQRHNEVITVLNSIATIDYGGDYICGDNECGLCIFGGKLCPISNLIWNETLTIRTISSRLIKYESKD